MENGIAFNCGSPVFHQLLYENSLSNNGAIAALIGYSDHSNFYKAFKDCYGMTPRDYFLSQ